VREGISYESALEEVNALVCKSITLAPSAVRRECYVLDVGHEERQLPLSKPCHKVGP
jgi:hypothetical protein